MMTPQSHMEQLLGAEVVRAWCRQRQTTDSRFAYDEGRGGRSASVFFTVAPAEGEPAIDCEVRFEGAEASLWLSNKDDPQRLTEAPFDQHALEAALDAALGPILGEQAAKEAAISAEAPTEEEAPFVEGAVATVALDRYERSRTARKACIAAHGTACAICGFDFGEAYGPQFAGIIQVHHIVPVSERGGAYKVDPVHDLMPVCPNCHVALHSKPGGTYLPGELRAILSNTKKQG